MRWASYQHFTSLQAVHSQALMAMAVVKTEGWLGRERMVAAVDMSDRCGPAIGIDRARAGRVVQYAVQRDSSAVSVEWGQSKVHRVRQHRRFMLAVRSDSRKHCRVYVGVVHLPTLCR